MRKVSQLKRLRVLAGLTQAECAESCEVTQGYWSYLERGIFIPSKNIQSKIMELFNCDSDIFK
ncbi:MAG: helix-turn-helix transcriptional regulator [Bacillaceae bacterium]|nr:helix-turn-helix transcriptional regulator [Bacillaceae bacterium]